MNENETVYYKRNKMKQQKCPEESCIYLKNKFCSKTKFVKFVKFVPEESLFCLHSFHVLITVGYLNKNKELERFTKVKGFA